MPSCEPTRQSAHSRTWAACQPACQRFPPPKPKPRASAQQPVGPTLAPQPRAGSLTRPHPGYHLPQNKGGAALTSVTSGPGMAGAGLC